MKKIRYAGGGDLPALARIYCQAWEKAYGGLIPQTHPDAGTMEERQEQLRQALRSRSEDIALVEEGVEILGFTLFGTSRDGDCTAETTGEIRGLYVSPSHWRQGIGRLLTEWVLGELRGQGFGTVTLWVLERSEMAAKFYESMRFSRDGSTREIGPGAPRVVRYRRELRSG